MSRLTSKADCWERFSPETVVVVNLSSDNSDSIHGDQSRSYQDGNFKRRTHGNKKEEEHHKVFN